MSSDVAYDSEYLQRVVGEALAEGLTDVAVAMPPDPVEYLAYWLLRHADNLDTREKLFLEKENVEKERREFEHDVEQKRLMRAEEERVMLQQARERAVRLEAERIQVHTQRLDEYEQQRAALDAALEERRVPVTTDQDTTADDEESSRYGSDAGLSDGGDESGASPRPKEPADRKLTLLEQCAARFEFVQDKLRALDPALLVAMAEWTPQTNAPLVQTVRAVMYCLGYSRSSVTAPTKWLEVTQLSAPGLIERMLRVDFARPLSAEKAKRVANATRQLAVRALVSKRPTGNFAAFIFFEWLRLGLELRNESCATKLENNEELADGDDVPYTVGEELAPADDEVSIDSDWAALLNENEMAAAAGDAADESYGGAGGDDYSYD